MSSMKAGISWRDDGLRRTPASISFSDHQVGNTHACAAKVELQDVRCFEYGSCHDVACHGAHCRGIPWCALSGHAMACHAMSCRAVPCYVAPCIAVLCEYHGAPCRIHAVAHHVVALMILPMFAEHKAAKQTRNHNVAVALQSEVSEVLTIVGPQKALRFDYLNIIWQ